MNAKSFLRRVGGFILAALLLPGIVLLSGATAQARGRWHGGRTVVIAPRLRVGPGWYGPRWYGYPYYRNGYSEFVFANPEVLHSHPEVEAIFCAFARTKA